MKRVRVDLGERSYDVTIEAGAIKHVADFLPRGFSPTRVFVISDENVAGLYCEVVMGSFREKGFETSSAVIPPGEGQKNLTRVESLYHVMLEAGLDRRSLVVALGGGVVGDVAGFAAGTYMRGIPIVQVATTIVAQVDSSVGGKTGVDLAEGKNLVGVFHQPLAVVIDPETLSTLPDKEVAAGLAEMIKHGVITDEDYFARLEKLGAGLLSMDVETAEEMIVRSVEVKADVVSRDEREGGLRAILNFGHTVGHALEALSGYSRFLHGEAVSVGMVAEAKIAGVLGLCDGEVAGRIASLLGELGLPTTGEGFAAGEVIEAFARDKKSVGGTARFVLPERIGRVRLGVEVEGGALVEGLALSGFTS